MNTDISIIRRDNFDKDGNFEASAYELQVESDGGEFLQTLLLDDPGELIGLRDAISHYLNRYDLIPSTDNTTEQ